MTVELRCPEHGILAEYDQHPSTCVEKCWARVPKPGHAKGTKKCGRPVELRERPDGPEPAA